MILLLVQSHITQFAEPYGTAESPVCFIHACPSFQKQSPVKLARLWANNKKNRTYELLSGVPDYFDRNKISSGGDLSHYSSASLY